MNSRSLPALLCFLSFLLLPLLAGAAPIHDLVRAGKVEQVKALLATDPTQVDALDEDHNTPLLYAISDAKKITRHW